MGDTRPKLEIVRLSGATMNVEFYVNGKCVDGIADGGGEVDNTVSNAISVACAVAQALGAEVVGEVDEPTPEPYRYFITYAVLATGWKAALTNPGQVFCSRWVSLDKGIEGPADTEAISRMIADEFSYPVLVNILGVTLMDGPC